MLNRPWSHATSHAGARSRRAPANLRERVTRSLRRARKNLQRFARRRPTLVFIAAYLFLNAVVNVRYPGKEPAFWYLVPSPDILFVFLYLAWFGTLGWTVPRAGRWALVALLFLVRFVRLGDGVQERFFAAQFNLYTDLPLAPELVRFVYSGVGVWEFVLLGLAALAAVGLFALTCYAALAHAEEYLAKRRQIYIAAGVTGALWFAAWNIEHKPQHDKLFYAGGLAASFLPRARHEARFLFNIYSQEARHGQAIAAVQDKYRQIPTNLAKLEGANVHLILVESYGQCVLEVPYQVEYMRKTFDAFEAELGAKGFSILTSFLDSSTYGGQSWLAHATLGTGVRTSNQLQYELVLAKKPRTIAAFFRDAGYRTVLVAPGTSRAWPKGEFYGFEQKYYGWQFDYAGPWFAWARMPDQFVLDFVRRRELASAGSRPLFIQYQLITSHAPWSDIPPVVEDWSQLGDGSIFHRLPRSRYNVKWPNFENATEAYVHSIQYDFEVLRTYIASYITDGSLVIILGDHQPVWDVNGHSDFSGVPVHVLSKNPRLLEPFVKLGYTPGVRKTPQGTYAGLETLLPDLLAGFSTHASR